MTGGFRVDRVPTVIVALLVSALASCAAATTETPGEGTNDMVGAAVCEAAAADSVRAAEQAFAGSHVGLHLLARDLQDLDERAAAGRLLEAKQLVEAELAELPPDQDVFRDLVELADATTTGLSILDPDTPRCDERTAP